MNEWMMDELVKDIPREKLELLAQIMCRKQNDGTQRQQMNQILSLVKEAKSKGIQFTPSETAAAITAIRKHSSPEENRRIDTILEKVRAGKT